MPTIVKTHAIALRVAPYSETSRVVTWLTPDFGKIPTLIKGAWRRKSAFLGQFDLFYTCELLFYLKALHGVHIVKECAPLKTRVTLRTRWRAAACASYLCGLMAAVCPAHAPHPELFVFLEQALDWLVAEPPSEAGLYGCELNLMQRLGLAPQFARCVKCGRAPDTVSAEGPVAGVRRAVPFSCAQGGVWCPACAAARAPDAVEIAPDSVAMLRYWQRSDGGRAARRSRGTPRQLAEIEAVLGRLLVYHLGVRGRMRVIALDLLRRPAAGLIP